MHIIGRGRDSIRGSAFFLEHINDKQCCFWLPRESISLNRDEMDWIAKHLYENALPWEMQTRFRWGMDEKRFVEFKYNPPIWRSSITFDDIGPWPEVLSRTHILLGEVFIDYHYAESHKAFREFKKSSEYVEMFFEGRM